MGIRVRSAMNLNFNPNAYFSPGVKAPGADEDAGEDGKGPVLNAAVAANASEFQPSGVTSDLLGGAGHSLSPKPNTPKKFNPNATTYTSPKGTSMVKEPLPSSISLGATSSFAKSLGPGATAGRVVAGGTKGAELEGDPFGKIQEFVPSVSGFTEFVPGGPSGGGSGGSNDGAGGSTSSMNPGQGQSPVGVAETSPGVRVPPNMVPIFRNGMLYFVPADSAEDADAERAAAGEGHLGGISHGYLRPQSVAVTPKRRTLRSLFISEPLRLLYQQRAAQIMLEVDPSDGRYKELPLHYTSLFPLDRREDAAGGAGKS